MGRPLLSGRLHYNLGICSSRHFYLALVFPNLQKVSLLMSENSAEPETKSQNSIETERLRLRRIRTLCRLWGRIVAALLIAILGYFGSQAVATKELQTAWPQVAHASLILAAKMGIIGLCVWGILRVCRDDRDGT